MDVEIDHGGALGAVLALGVAGGDRGIVEQAEAHRPRGLGVVAGRADGDEGVGDLARHHLVDRMHRAAGGAHRRLETSRRHRGVGVDLHQTLRRRGIADGGDVVHRMTERDGLELRGRRLDARQRVERIGIERLRDGAQPVRPLRMARGRAVLETGGMGDQQRGHWGDLSLPRGNRKVDIPLVSRAQLQPHERSGMRDAFSLHRDDVAKTRAARVTASRCGASGSGEGFDGSRLRMSARPHALSRKSGEDRPSRCAAAYQSASSVSTNASPPGGCNFFRRAPGQNPPFGSPRKTRGVKRRKSLVRSAAPRGPPCGRADPFSGRDHRPMTLAGAPFGASPRRSHSGVGPRFRPDTFPDRQPAPGRRLVVASRAEPRRRPGAR